MAPIIAGIVASLIKEGLPKVADAVLTKGVDYVEQKLGVKLEVDASNDLTSEKLAEVRARAMQHEEFMQELIVKNTSDARDMQKVALNQTDTFSKRAVYWFIAFWSVAAALYIGFVTFGTVPEDNIRIVDTMIGFVQGTVVATMFNFLLGSSNGSMRKTDMLGKKE